MVLIGAISWFRGVLLFIIQIVAGIVAAYIVQALFQGKLALSTTLGGGTTVAQAVVIEMILTAQLVFTIFMLAAEKHTGNFIAPVGIGLSLFVAELTGQSGFLFGISVISLLYSESRTCWHFAIWSKANFEQEYSGLEVPSIPLVPLAPQ